MTESALPTYGAGTLGGVSYAELPDSMSFQISGGRARGIRRFRVAWADRFEFIKEQLGLIVWVNGEISARFGAAQFPGYDLLSAQDVQIEGEGRIANSSGDVQYTSAIITVTYLPTTMDENEDEDARVTATEQMDFGGEFLLAPEGSLKWGSYYRTMLGQASATNIAEAGKPLQQQTRILTPTIDFVYTKSDLDEIPKTAIKNCLGRVNDGAWPPGSADAQTIDAQYLLFFGGTARRTFKDESAQPYELTLVFRYRMPHWNMIWKGGNTTTPAEGWALTQPPIYQQADFTPLFKYTAGSS